MRVCATRSERFVINALSNGGPDLGIDPSRAFSRYTPQQDKDVVFLDAYLMPRMIDSPALIFEWSNQTPLPRSVRRVANSLAGYLSGLLWLMNILMNASSFPFNGLLVDCGFRPTHHVDLVFSEGRPGRSRLSSASNALWRLGDARWRKFRASLTTSLLFTMCPCRANAERIDSTRFESSCDSEKVIRIVGLRNTPCSVPYVT
jgi:hypothetical protein